MSTRALIMAQAHDSAVGNHRGNYKTFALVSRDHYWRKQYAACCEYVQLCSPCQRSKVDQQARSGILNPLEVPQEPWDHITMDFVSGFPLQRNCDQILVVVDRLFKMAHFIPCKKEGLEALHVARLLLERVFSLHGFPLSITSDQDRLFKAELFQAYMRQWNVKSHFTAADHPETDGQSERTINTVRELIRTAILCTTAKPLCWVDIVPMVDFAYNNSEHSVTGCTPFFVNYKCHPRIPLRLPENPFNYRERMTETARAEFFCEMHHAVIARARDAIGEYQLTMQCRVNQHRRVVTFQVGESVLVRRDQIYRAGKNDKYYHVYMGPYRVVEVLNDNAYVVHISALPGKRETNKTFNVSMLKPFNYRANNYERHPPTRFAEVVASHQNIVKIIKVLEDRIVLEWAESTFPVTLTRVQYAQIPWQC